MLTPQIENIQKQILTYKVNDLFDIILTEEDGELISSAWVNHTKIRNSHLCYLDKNQLNECIEKMRYSSDFSFQAADYAFENKIDVLISGNALKENCYFYSGYSFALFDCNGDAVSLPMWFDSFTERVPNCPIFEKIMHELQNHPYVKELEIEQIKSYNSNFKGQRGIKRAKVYLPDEIYKNFYAMLKDSKPKIDFYDLLKLKVWDANSPDVYGIIDLLVQYNRIKEYYDEDEE